MSIAGPEDEQTGDEVEGIRYFDFAAPSGSDAPSAVTDPFAAEIPSESHGTSDREEPQERPIRTKRAEDQTRKPVPPDPFEYALTGPPPNPPPSEPSHAAPSRTEPPVEGTSQVGFFKLASLFEPTEANGGSRERFVSAFDTARAERGRSFLAIALRMPAASPASLHFPVVVEGVRSDLAPGDALLADEDRLRLVVLFRDRSAEDARTFFARLRDYLRDGLADADEVLRDLSAFVAPKGKPFDDAAEFLARAFDEA